MGNRCGSDDPGEHIAADLQGRYHGFKTNTPSAVYNYRHHGAKMKAQRGPDCGAAGCLLSPGGCMTVIVVVLFGILILQSLGFWDAAGAWVAIFGGG